MFRNHYGIEVPDREIQRSTTPNDVKRVDVQIKIDDKARATTGYGKRELAAISTNKSIKSSGFGASKKIASRG